MTTTDRSSRRCVPRLCILAVVAGLFLVGCGDDSSDTQAVPEGQGETLYRQSCASCHGTDLRGTASGPSHLSAVYEPGHHPDDSFRSAIEEGAAAHHWNFGDMPPVPGLDAGEVDAIIGYIREQQTARGLEAYPPG